MLTDISGNDTPSGSDVAQIIPVASEAPRQCSSRYRCFFNENMRVCDGDLNLFFPSEQ